MIICTDTANVQTLIDMALESMTKITLSNIHTKCVKVISWADVASGVRYKAESDNGDVLNFNLVDNEVTGDRNGVAYTRPIGNFTLNLAS